MHSDKGNADLRKRLYSLSRLSSAADNRGNRAQYTLDAMSNRTREEVKDARGNTTGYQYDAFGRITGKTQFIADDPGVASNYSTRYAYSSAGELSQISYPSGLKIYYRRNASGQITGIDGQQPGADKPIAPFSAT